MKYNITMGSPGIDLDMNLLSSPVPPTPRNTAGRNVDGRSERSQAQKTTNQIPIMMHPDDAEDGPINSDVNLLGPIPPARGDGASKNGGDYGRSEINQAPNMSIDDENCPTNSTKMKNGTFDSFSELNAKRSGEVISRPANATMTSRGHSKETTDNANVEFTKDETGSERVRMSTQNYDRMTQTVESWREELYMMNVKNSILLDDLVKLGADV
mmetsp:Transcript_20022/g.41978  ORF Transcript_20022/g.41978 Transcript_20022/m.41978 type:complete len:213 (-) Transcript_20022:1530-2168(-)